MTIGESKNAEVATRSTWGLALPFTLERDRDYPMKTSVEGLAELCQRVLPNVNWWANTYLLVVDVDGHRDVLSHYATLAEAKLAVMRVPGAHIEAYRMPGDSSSWIRFSSQVHLDTKDHTSKLITWDQGVVRDLVVHSIGATDRWLSFGNIAVTACKSGSVTFTVNQFNWTHDHGAGVAICRDAWLAGQRDRAIVIAKQICPHTWPVLIAACEVDRGLADLQTLAPIVGEDAAIKLLGTSIEHLGSS